MDEKHKSKQVSSFDEQAKQKHARYPYPPNENLKQERIRRGWTQQHLAKLIELGDWKTVGRWESGKSFPSDIFRQKLLDVFQMNIDTLGLTKKVLV